MHTQRRFGVRILTIAILALGGVLTVAGSARADVIVFYALNTPPQSVNDAPVPATSAATGVLAGALTPNDPLQNFRTDHFTPLLTGLNASPAPGGLSKTVDTAFNHSTFSFTVTPPAGKEFDLTSLTFNVVSGGSANPSDLRGVGIRSSLTGGTDLVLSPDVSSLPVPPSASEFVTLSFGSNPAFHNIQGPVTFTFAVATNNGNDTIVFNDITLNGTVAPIMSPEPSSLALLTLGGIALAGWRRLRKRHVA
jgi:hypothetical protein